MHSRPQAGSRRSPRPRAAVCQVTDGGSPARETGDVADSTGDGTTLRLALGMRGGVSLAVWIGGAASELDALRAAAHDPSSSAAGLLALGGYTGVQIDVLSGGRAGGADGGPAASGEDR